MQTKNNGNATVFLSLTVTQFVSHKIDAFTLLFSMNCDEQKWIYSWNEYEDVDFGMFSKLVIGLKPYNFVGNTKAISLTACLFNLWSRKNLAI